MFNPIRAIKDWLNKPIINGNVSTTDKVLGTITGLFMCVLSLALYLAPIAILIMIFA